MADDKKNPGKKIRSVTGLKTVAGAILSVGMALAVIAVLFFSWMAEEVFEGESKGIDNTVREFVHGFAADWLTRVMQLFAFLGSTVFLASASILIILFFLFRRRFRSALLLTAVMVGAIVLNYALKVSFSRPRPVPYFDTPLPTSFSFPSGHALFSVCFYGILAWLISSRAENKTLQIATWTAAVVMAFFIGMSRIYLGVHYPTDVVAGYVAAFVWVSVVVLADSVLGKDKNSDERS